MWSSSLLAYSIQSAGADASSSNNGPAPRPTCSSYIPPHLYNCLPSSNVMPVGPIANGPHSGPGHRCSRSLSRGTPHWRAPAVAGAGGSCSLNCDFGCLNLGSHGGGWNSRFGGWSGREREANHFSREKLGGECLMAMERILDDQPSNDLGEQRWFHLWGRRWGDPL